MIINEVPTDTTAAERAPRWSHLVPSVAAVVVDLLVMTAVTLAAAYGRMRLPFFNAVGDVDNLVAIVGVPVVLGWVAAIALTGGYASHVMGAGATEYKLVVRGTMVAAGTIGVVCYLMKFQFSRGFFFLLILFGVPALLIGRLVLRRVMHGLRRRGHLVSRVVVAGSTAQVDEVARVLNRERWLGYRVVGAVVPASADGVPGLLVEAEAEAVPVVEALGAGPPAGEQAESPAAVIRASRVGIRVLRMVGSPRFHSF